MEPTVKAIYYPGSAFSCWRTFCTAALYFDEIHLVSMADINIEGNSEDAYTEYMRNLHPKLALMSFGEGDAHPVSIFARQYQFAMRIRPLIGEVVKYRYHLVASHAASLSQRLIAGKLSVEEFAAIGHATTPEMIAVRAFHKEHPDLDDEELMRILPTARWLMREEGLVPISDIERLPAPIVQPLDRTVAELAGALGAECLQFVLPSPTADVAADDLAEVRLRLTDELRAFRMMMRRLSLSLRELLRSDPTREDLTREAKFLAESSILPAVDELERRLAAERGQLWKRVFGSIVGWVPVIARSFLGPTIDFTALADKAATDISEFLREWGQIDEGNRLGLSFLLKAHDSLIYRKG